MGLVELDVETIGSELYLTLGIHGLNKEVQQTPRVLSLLSPALERGIQRDEKLLEMSTMKDGITVFHGLRPPSLSIKQYIYRIFKYANCSPACFVLAYIYIDRFLQKPGNHLTSLNVHRLLITSMVVAVKFIDDAFYNNAYYAKVGGISPAEMNRLELKLLFSLDFRLQVNMETFGKYCLLLEKEASPSGYKIERPIPVQVYRFQGCPKKADESQQIILWPSRCSTV